MGSCECGQDPGFISRVSGLHAYSLLCLYTTELSCTTSGSRRTTGSGQTAIEVGGGTEDRDFSSRKNRACCDYGLQIYWTIRLAKQVPWLCGSGIGRPGPVCCGSRVNRGSGSTGGSE